MNKSTAITSVALVNSQEVLGHSIVDFLVPVNATGKLAAPSKGGRPDFGARGECPYTVTTFAGDLAGYAVVRVIADRDADGEMVYTARAVRVSELVHGCWTPGSAATHSPKSWQLTAQDVEKLFNDLGAYGRLLMKKAEENAKGAAAPAKPQVAQTAKPQTAKPQVAHKVIEKMPSREATSGGTRKVRRPVTMGKADKDAELVVAAVAKALAAPTIAPQPANVAPAKAVHSFADLHLA